MKRILSILLFVIITVTAFGQSQFKYVTVPQGDNDQYNATQWLESKFADIGIYPRCFADTYKNLSINPYEMIYVQRWEWNPLQFDPWYIKLSDCTGKIFYEGPSRKFFRKPHEFLPTLRKITHSHRSEDPETWNEKSLKEKYWVTHKAIALEGIYQSTEAGGYKCAIVQYKEKLLLILLGDYPIWKSGEVIGVISGYTNSIFSIQWTDSSKQYALNVFGRVDEVGLHVDFSKTDIGLDQLHFLKIYSPTQETKKHDSNGGIKTGSGIVLTADGVIATNHHVIEDAKDIKVQLNISGEFQTYKAKLIISDKTCDLALLQINDIAFKNLPSLPYALNARICDVGTTVFAMGYPLSSILGQEVKVTDGLISSKTGYENDIMTYQISAPIQPGSSGGPLFDKNGNLVGLTNAGIPDAQNIGYAIKTSYLKLLVEMAPTSIKLPVNNTISHLPLSQQIKKLSPYVALITAE